MAARLASLDHVTNGVCHLGAIRSEQRGQTETFFCHRRVERKSDRIQKTFWDSMIDALDSVLLLALIYLSGVLWHLDKATGKRSSPLWSLLWPLALWLNVHGKSAKRH